MTNGERLDSWKAIAAYLHRDERTVRRWEKTLGLPVRRVPGGPGHSVFALSAEIDTWLLNRALQPASVPVSPVPRRDGWRVSATISFVALLTIVAVWGTTGRVADAMPARVDFTTSALVAFRPDGGEQWRFRFPAGQRVEIPGERLRHPVDILAAPGSIVTATQLQVVAASETVRGGELLALSSDGALQRTFTFDDHLTFAGGTTYDSPWGITDFRVSPAGDARFVALAAHHYQWWPSMITVLDERFRRRGTFVNAGWLERVHWLSNDQLLVSGFSDSRDGGVVALLDAQALDGQSPEEEDSPFHCDTCGDGRPLRYIVMPRSELNRVTGSRFNRARIEVDEDGITVRTLEAQMDDESAVDALYEFTPALDLVRASFSERYWEEHRALEAQGKIHHTREECPDRDGPREIQMWEARSGWTTVRTR